MSRPKTIRKCSPGILFCTAAALLFISIPTARCAEPKADSGTLALLKRWDGDGEATLATLFATGQSRERELAAFCRSDDQKLHAEAYFVLLLIGSNASVDCSKNLKLDGKAPTFLRGDILTGADLDRVEKSILDNPCKRNQDCREQECPEVDESVGYALILNGSDRALTLAKRIAASFKTCWGEGLMVAEPFLRAESLNNVSSKARNLQLDTANFESVMKQSAFFVPEDRQEAISVDLLARNETNSRMLVEVSYRCGMLCGSGYYVVLKKNSAGRWDYVLIVRGWIS